MNQKFITSHMKILTLIRRTKIKMPTFKISQRYKYLYKEIY